MEAGQIRKGINLLAAPQAQDGAADEKERDIGANFGRQAQAIKGGKLGPMIADVAYQSRTPDFWSSCDGIGGQALWENVGLDADGKGQPGQINAMSHGCAPARFRRVNVLRTS